VRENRTHGSEGGDGESRFRPLSDLGLPIYLARQAAGNEPLSDSTWLSWNIKSAGKREK
jgi:hypothetical protein